MTDLQKTELELLKCFIDICSKLNIKYYLICGSALGAVKYNGFIPWDDDIDVGLLREDYELFCKKAVQFLPSNYFLQTYETDPNYPNIFAKIRDSNTTYIERSYSKIPMNHGVYIDIFPLDGYPIDKKTQTNLERKKLIYKLLLSCVYESECSLKMKIFKKILRCIGIHKNTQLILKKYEKLISKHSTSQSEMLCNHGNWQGKLEYANKKQYGEGTIKRFEGLEVIVPEKFDEYLTQKYGDWRAELPIEMQKGHHYYVVCDLKTPYNKYWKLN